MCISWRVRCVPSRLSRKSSLLLLYSIGAVLLGVSQNGQYGRRCVLRRYRRRGCCTAESEAEVTPPSQTRLLMIEHSLRFGEGVGVDSVQGPARYWMRLGFFGLLIRAFVAVTGDNLVCTTLNLSVARYSDAYLQGVLRADPPNRDSQFSLQPTWEPVIARLSSHTLETHAILRLHKQSGVRGQLRCYEDQSRS
ncbi:hypothetical protein BKA82DRAFT_194045 [Pisolithus tinctorius]|uniref:Uncharacterized protein n=1 Tax=Pisolithus tinctorius Marx 270 TaxID=870435 RepID=A0A0C3KZM4_PISTI|nr:hypothetical protein BKA82DRAFT_194045 [Pisolithus tinctorius]KIO14932.1 hypothetical protein M404DRAFT_194045 [Pisolithus tinctorius Marx 270]